MPWSESYQHQRVAEQRHALSSLPVKRVIVSVTNDLSTDQRVDKVIRSIRKLGAELWLVGRALPDSLPLDRPYRCIRMKLFFNKGPAFYAEYNLRLFFFLLFNRADVLLANDLDTLLANYLASKFKRCQLVYDSHEYYTEVPELTGRPRVQRIWQRIESWIFPKLKHVYTVNDSIANIYREKYGVPVKVVRNLPAGQSVERFLNRSELGLPDDAFVLVLQGAGINVDRGAEELVSAMKGLPDCFLAIVGSGDVVEQLKMQAKADGVEDRILFRPRMPYTDMMQYALNANLGLSLDKDTNLNYRFSLPNKVFDYLRAGIPVLVSNLPEISKVVKTYDVGEVLEEHSPEHIEQVVKKILSMPEAQNRWRENTKFASQALNWENQEEVLFEIWKPLV